MKSFIFCFTLMLLTVNSWAVDSSRVANYGFLENVEFSKHSKYFMDDEVIAKIYANDTNDPLFLMVYSENYKNPNSKNTAIPNLIFIINDTIPENLKLNVNIENYKTKCNNFNSGNTGSCSIAVDDELMNIFKQNERISVVLINKDGLFQKKYKYEQTFKIPKYKNKNPIQLLTEINTIKNSIYPHSIFKCLNCTSNSHYEYTCLQQIKINDDIDKKYGNTNSGTFGDTCEGGFGSCSHMGVVGSKCKCKSNFYNEFFGIIK